MSKREYKEICNTTFVNCIAYCTLECLHKSNKSQGDYIEKRRILDYMLEHPNESARSIAKLFGVSKSVTERLSYFTTRKRKYVGVNERFFENIDSEEKAYWLGFLYADGYVSKRKQNNCVVELCLAIKDFEHLVKFKKSLNLDADIKIKNVQLNEKTFKACRVGVYRLNMYNDLVDKGCVENKYLILKFPKKSIFSNIDLIRHFIRGYVDGDGSICLIGDKNIPTLSILGTEDFLTGVLKYFKQHHNYSGKNSVIRCKSKGKDNIFDLRFSYKNAKFVLDILYKNSTIYLDRKYDKYSQICNK